MICAIFRAIPTGRPPVRLSKSSMSSLCEDADKVSLPLIALLRKWLIGRTSIVEIEQHYLIASVLSDQSVVMDLGANMGRFSAQVLARFGCQVFAVEPEQANYEAIQEHPKLRKFQAAVGGKCGRSGISISSDSTGHRLHALAGTETATEQVVTVHDFPSLMALGDIRRIDVMKLDVEGSEWDWLDSMSDEQLKSVGQLTVEFHGFLPEYRESNRTWANYQRLMGLGFHCIEDPKFGSYNVLFVNRRIMISRLADRVLLPVLGKLLGMQWKLSRLQQRLLPSA